MHAHTALLSLLVPIATAQISVSLRQHVTNNTVKVVNVGVSDFTNVTDASGNPALSRRAISTIATNRWNSYTATVSVGNPPKAYKLMLDNGSSNTWIKAFNLTKTSRAQKDGYVTVNYGIGTYNGRQYWDDLSIGSATVHNQSLSRANHVTGYSDVDGLLAFGPTALSQSTVQGTDTVPTFVDNMYAQKLITSKTVGVSFNPVTMVLNQDGAANGELTLGGYNPSQFSGSLTYLNVTDTYPSSLYWGLEAQYIAYKTPKKVVQLLSSKPSRRSGIIDTGTTLIKLPSDAFATYVSQLPGAKINADGFLAIPNAVVATMGDVVFKFGDAHFTLSPSAQLFPPQVAKQFGQQASGFSYSVFADSQTTNSGLDFTLGMMFLERYYSVYNWANQTIAFAETPYTFQRTNPYTPNATGTVTTTSKPAPAKTTAPKATTSKSSATSAKSKVKAAAAELKQTKSRKCKRAPITGKRRVQQALDKRSFGAVPIPNALDRYAL